MLQQIYRELKIESRFIIPDKAEVVLSSVNWLFNQKSSQIIMMMAALGLNDLFPSWWFVFNYYVGRIKTTNGSYFFKISQFAYDCLMIINISFNDLMNSVKIYKCN